MFEFFLFLVKLIFGKINVKSDLWKSKGENKFLYVINEIFNILV